MSRIVIAVFVALVAFAAPTISAAEPFTLKTVDAESVALYEGARPVWRYVPKKIVHNWVDAKDGRRVAGCYFHPLYGLDGTVLTVNATTGDNHQHHHGMWPSFFTVAVHAKDGTTKTYDTWSDNGPLKRDLVAVEKMETQGDTFVLRVENGWFLEDGTKIMKERLELVTHKTQTTPEGRLRALDVAITLEPVADPITLAGDIKLNKNFSCLTVRFIRPEKSPLILSEQGEVKGDPLRFPAKWLDYQTVFAPEEKTRGVAFFASPKNPKHETGWAVRHYGMIVTGWPGCEGATLKPGEPATLAYRVVLHDAQYGVKQLDALYAEYAK